jgi:2-amino-4-hydroxy-6-hydroxymethyldihydropteridine diphosphokinase
VTGGAAGHSPRTHRVVLALGSNLGDRLNNLQGGTDALLATPGLNFVAVSPVYETDPAGGPAQPDYLNAVLIAETALPARVILEAGLDIERAFHRIRDVPNGPRTLDIDVVVYGDEVSDNPGLILPHPRAHERAFVLAPWLDADPGAQIPGRGRVADLLASVSAAGVRRRDDYVIKRRA